MERLLDAVSKLVSQVSPDKVGSLAGKVEKLSGPEDATSLMLWTGTAAAKKLLIAVIDEWKAANVSPSILSGVLIGASDAYHKARGEESVELVWTGPSTGLVSVRRTEQALLEVIQSATRELFLISFVAYEVSSIVDALNEAAGRGVQVTMLIESSEAHGGQNQADCVGNMRKAVPAATVLVWSASSKDAEGGGYRIVHGKGAVADGRIAFITSANLTPAALEKNMELGVLIRSNRLPKQLHDHLKALITTEVIV